MKRFAAIAAALCTASALFGAYRGHKIEMSNPDGYYKTGETAVCRITLCEDGKPLSGTKARVITYWEGKPKKLREFVTTGKPVEVSYKSDKPGWVYFRFQVMDAQGKTLSGKGVFKHPAKTSTTAEAGALFSADEIRSGIRRPADFERFWAERRAKLDRVPIKPVYKRLPDPEPGIKFFTVEIPCLGEFPVSGYLALPAGAKPKSCPAYVDWASWMASDTEPRYAIRRAQQGAIGFTPTWHGRPCNMGKDYYNYNTTIRIKGGIVGIEDKEKWCFSDMYYRVMRSLDFVKSLPEWDGKTLVSVGGSLGGAQSTAAAALDKDVTTAVINVPCFCEFDGEASGRRSSIPIPRIADRIRSGDRKPLETTAYFDCVNFAPMIKCETYVCTGFSDELCPPSNVFAFYNAIPATTKKLMSTSPFTGHYGTTANPKAAKRLEELRGATKVFRFDVKQ
ncbi:MAG: acetylxylan esterase [Lentisphaeria bacterium]|nr:acetylxylan esterase [Lentisphaeria bacterium]